MNEVQPSGQQSPGNLQGGLKEQHGLILIHALICCMGAFLASYATIVGVALVAFGAVALRSDGRFPVAVVMTILGAGACFFFGISDGATAVAMALAALLIACMAEKRCSQVQLFLSVVVIAVALLGVDVGDAYLAGTTVQGRVAAMTTTMIQQLTAAGTVPAESVTIIQDALTTVAQIWPSLYFFEGVLYVGTTVIIARVTYRHLVAGFDGPHFSEFDLTIHSAWPLIAGLLLLALSYTGVDYADLAKVVAFNLIVCSAFLFAVQGFALIDYFMKRAKWHWALQVLIYILALQLELMFLIPSFMGLIDLWANIRKLPRGRGPTLAETNGRTGDEPHQ